ncbi:NAD(P)H-dependent flavin oxidoreductase [Humitalea sp. 24SJ18S-53]|uniref:NAD(P)H-dependent flavin oxidoreductase n=1 Tax=Humitalea sp. 24SJ18S-53 TaxID=3422307 RepID=UPI003D668DD2
MRLVALCHTGLASRSRQEIIIAVLSTPLCARLSVRYPIVQAGMGIYRGLLTTPPLVAAVSNAGGMGCLGGSGLTPEELRDAIRAVRALTPHPFGVDLILPARLSTRDGTREEIRAEIRKDHPRHWAFVDALHERHGVPRLPIDLDLTWTPALTGAQTQVVLEERVPLFVVALGDPTELMPRARAVGTLVAGLVGSLGNLRRQIAAGVDLIVCQGAEAGGHVGTISTFPLLPQVVDAAGDIPVLAGGGIADGRGVAAALALGAQGVWCGTAFLFAEEAYLHPDHRAQIVDGRSEDFLATRIYTGKTARTFRNVIHAEWAATGLEPLGMPHQKVLLEDFLHSARQAGRLDLVSNPAGQVAGMLRDIRPAAAILRDLVTGAAATIGRLGGFAVEPSPSTNGDTQPC